MAVKKGKMITVTSVKGGVGKTTFILTLAGIYARKNKKVLIIDMDLFSGDIEAILNKDSKKDLYTLFEDITNNNFSNIDSYITQANEFIDFLAAPKDPRYASKITSKFLNSLFSKVITRYDVILVDTNHVLNEINLVTFDNSNQILYLINNNSMNLKNMRTMISIFSDMQLKNYKIILYDACDKTKAVFKKFDIKNIIKDNIDYVISNDFYIKDIDKYIINSQILDLSNKFLKHKNIKVLEQIADDLIK